MRGLIDDLHFVVKSSISVLGPEITSMAHRADTCTSGTDADLSILVGMHAPSD